MDKKTKKNKGGEESPKKIVELFPASEKKGDGKSPKKLSEADLKRILENC